MSELHTFHIPVMGLGYTVDTPIKAARFGISSVVSIIEDELLEQMRKFHAEKTGEEYSPINEDHPDHRALRITAYLNLLERIVAKQMEVLKAEPFEPGREISNYFELLPDNLPLKKSYVAMRTMAGEKEKEAQKEELRKNILPGSIDVNIMTKCDRVNYAKDGTPLGNEYADAMAALRGFAQSNLSSSVVFSAGMNPRLYGYCETFDDFFPDEYGNLKKKITLKVSDFRSALVQGKFLAKKGIWVSEFRIESGLNCGGHAFATEGMLLGPILDEFRLKRKELSKELYTLCNEALKAKAKFLLGNNTLLKITVQGGIGTANEHQFLLDHYGMDRTGWGSPFLLVPEVTNVDDETLGLLASAEKDDFFLSHASPLGIPFHNFRKSSAEKQRMERIRKGRPGSPCYKKFLSFNTEFSREPICTASREYQEKKIKQIQSDSPAGLVDILEKDCLCEGLGAAALLKNSIPLKHNLPAVTICPGPNLAYFSGIFSLKEMADHIYGRSDILNTKDRPHMFINELSLYTDYLKNEIKKNLHEVSAKHHRYLETFKNNLLKGINYYKSLIPSLKGEAEKYKLNFKRQLTHFELILVQLVLPERPA